MAPSRYPRIAPRMSRIAISQTVLRRLARCAARKSVALTTVTAAGRGGSGAGTSPHGPCVVLIVPSSAQVHLRRFLLGLRHFEIGSGLEIEGTGDEVRGEALDGVVQAHDAVVVELAGGHNHGFRRPHV